MSDYKGILDFRVNRVEEVGKTEVEINFGTIKLLDNSILFYTFKIHIQW